MKVVNKQDTKTKEQAQVIWFNHNFSSVVNIILDMKKAFKDAKIIGSNKLQQCTYTKIVDKFYVEPGDEISDSE